MCCIQAVAPGDRARERRRGLPACQPPDGDPLDRFQEPPFASSTCRRPLLRLCVVAAAGSGFACRVCRQHLHLHKYPAHPSLQVPLEQLLSSWLFGCCSELDPHWPTGSLEHLPLFVFPSNLYMWEEECAKMCTNNPSVAQSAGSTPRPPFSGEQQGGRRSGRTAEVWTQRD